MSSVLNAMNVSKILQLNWNKLTGFSGLVADSRLGLCIISGSHPWPQHPGVDRCLSDWGMCGHCLLRVRVESVSSFGRMDEDGFAPYLRTRCPWRLAATVGQAPGAPSLDASDTVLMWEAYSFTECICSMMQ